MARIVIADAGPLIAFASIDALWVLQNLFSGISVAESVKCECLSKPGKDAQRIETATDEGLLLIFPPDNDAEPLSPSLGLGESDSIRYALESPEDSLLIVDDRLARRFALKQGINIIGTARLLDLAEQRGLIESAEHCISDMAEIGYRISVELLKQIRSE